ncbi:MAG: hypothetical protein GPJ52_04565 [Candidatus Heimdallarchaeota archaeon]|nr:hypothetical protein [Candidatus Heimdallarchaeota archaeon]
MSEKKRDYSEYIRVFVELQKFKTKTIDNEKDEKKLRKLIQDWTNHVSIGENLLTAFCLKHQRKIPVFSDYPFIVKYQYEFVPGHSNHGEGDLLLKDENERYLVVEVKYIDHSVSGRNQTVKRRKKRRKVEEQVEKNVLKVRELFPTTDVKGLVLTNETIPYELREKFEEYKQQKTLAGRYNNLGKFLKNED